jgi:transcriptional regulator with XRE-family HTH domain
MATINKEKLKKYISKEKSTWLDQADFYEANKEWLDKSALIAVKILSTLKSKSITQKELAEEIGVSPQYINKVVKGFENLSLETICKIEKSLGITLVSVPSYESSQVIADNFLPFSDALSRNMSKPIASEKIDCSTTSNYYLEEETLAA